MDLKKLSDIELYDEEIDKLYLYTLRRIRIADLTKGNHSKRYTKNLTDFLNTRLDYFEKLKEKIKNEVNEDRR